MKSNRQRPTVRSADCSGPGVLIAALSSATRSAWWPLNETKRRRRLLRFQPDRLADRLPHGSWKLGRAGLGRDRSRMRSISETEFDRLLYGIEHESLHLETRDAYGTETESPYMAKWAKGEPDDLSWLADWYATVHS